MAEFLERVLSPDEFAIAEWLLKHAATGAAENYIAQLSGMRVIGQCKCGCPSITLRVADSISSVEPCANPIADAFGTVNGKKVGVMLLQKDGRLTDLEIYDLSDIERPYGLPDLNTLKAAHWTEVPVSSPKLTRSAFGILVKAKTGTVVTSEMVKELSEDDLP